MNRLSRFAQYAWFNVGYIVLVIMWGAVVRATGSGAGCGNHWPVCNGEVIPRAESVEVLIEFSHRVTSALAGIFIIGLLVWAWSQRSKDNGKLIWLGAIMSLVFVIVEGGLGAMLVRLELVEDNASVMRAVVIGLHLLNTYMLLLWLVLTAWAATVKQVHMQLSRTAWLLIFGAGAMALLSAAGAVTALGDTLLLSGSLAAQFGEESAAEHFLVELRVIHPVMAIFVSLLLLWIGYNMTSEKHPQSIRRLSYALMAIIAVQVLGGIATIALRAPIVMQMFHLLLADTMWITLLLLTFEGTAHLRDVPAAQLQATPAGD